jgi:hypothetical protein
MPSSAHHDIIEKIEKLESLAMARTGFDGHDKHDESWAEDIHHIDSSEEKQIYTDVAIPPL